MTRHPSRIYFAALCISALISVAAHGADRLPSNIKTSGTPSIFASQIQGLIDTTAAKFASDDPQIQQSTRNILVNECQNHSAGGGGASAQYQTEYCADLNNACMRLLKDKAGKNPRVRVNIGVTVTEVAKLVFNDGGDTSKFAPVVESLLTDSQTADVLWGIKAAKYVMAGMIENAGNPSTLSKLIVKAMAVHGQSGPIVEEAYNSLTLASAFGKLTKNPALNLNQAILQVLPDLLDLIAWRAAQYANGSPPSPLAEQTVPVFLSSTVYGALSSNAAMTNRALKVMGELTCASVKAVVNGNTSPELIEMVKGEGRFFDVMGDGNKLGNPAVKAAGQAIAGINDRTDPNKMTARCGDLTDALKSAGVNIGTDETPGAAQTPPPAVAGAPK